MRNRKLFVLVHWELYSIIHPEMRASRVLNVDWKLYSKLQSWQRAIIPHTAWYGQGPGADSWHRTPTCQDITSLSLTLPKWRVHFGPEASGHSTFMDISTCSYSCYCLLICPQAQPTQICPSPMPRKPVESRAAHHVGKTVPFSQDCNIALFQDHVT